MAGNETVALERDDVVNLSIVLIYIEDSLNWANCKDLLFS